LLVLGEHPTPPSNNYGQLISSSSQSSNKNARMLGMVTAQPRLIHPLELHRRLQLRRHAGLLLFGSRSAERPERSKKLFMEDIIAGLLVGCDVVCVRYQPECSKPLESDGRYH
jgi:hypothetical protein